VVGVFAVKAMRATSRLAPKPLPAYISPDTNKALP
jgi:hypothetical protein